MQKLLPTARLSNCRPPEIKSRQKLHSQHIRAKSSWRFLLSVLSLVLICTGASAQNLGFEGSTSSPPTSWTAVTGTWPTTTAAGTFRTGSNAMAITGAATSGTTIYNTSGFATSTSPGYLITIAWGKANQPNNGGITIGYRGSSTVLNPASVSSGTPANLNNSTWTRITSVSASGTIAAGSYGPSIRAYQTASSPSTTIYIDDLITYASATATPDLTVPTEPSGLTVSSGSGYNLSWTNGSDAGSGLGGVVIVRTDGLNADAPFLNDQAMYATTNGAAGTSSFEQGGNTWTVVGTINNGTTTSFNDASATTGADYTYAVFMRDRAYNYSAANTANSAAPADMTYLSSNVLQASTGFVYKNTTNQVVLKIEVKTSNVLNPLSATQFNLNTTGTTNPADITNARLWYTGSSNTFATTTQFGSDEAAPNGSFSFTGSQQLAGGNNYFWLTYDVPNTAAPGNLIDAEVTAITIDGADRTPTTTAPAGNRKIVAPFSGVYTIDQTGSGTRNFTSFTDAINELNTLGIAGDVRFEVAAGQTFNENVPVITATGSMVDTIGFIKAGLGNNPVITPSGTSGTFDAGIVISGGDYLAFDGIDIASTGTAVEYGYLIRNSSETNGALHNTICNAKITLSKSSTNMSIGVLQSSNTSFGGAITPTINNSGVNQYNRYHHLTIENANSGILLSSGSGTYADNECQVYNCIIGGSTAGDLGFTTGTAQGFGIKATIQNNIKIYNNEVRNLTTYSAQADGVFLDQGYGVCEIYNNKVHDVRNGAGTGTGTGVVTGMRVNLYTTVNGHTSKVYNNFIYNITHGFTGSAVSTIRIRGIYVQSNGSGTGSTHNIDFNTVKIDGSGSLNHSSTCLDIGTTSGTTMKIRNNIFANVTAAQTGSPRHMAVTSSSATLIGPDGSVSDNNILYIADSGNGYVGLGNTTVYATLGSWITAMTNDANSKASNPQFSGNELFLSATQPTEAEGGAGFAGDITWVTTDIEGNPRVGNAAYTGTGTAADIGADEGEFVPSDVTAPGIVYTDLTDTNLLTNRTLTATITDASALASGTNGPRMYYKKSTETAYQFDDAPLKNGDDYTFTIDYSKLTGGSVDPGDIIYYYVAAQDEHDNLRSNPAGATGITPPGTTGPGTANAFKILATLNGNYLVGTSRPASYPTITAAINALNTGVVTGDVTFELIDSDYSTDETFPIVINEPIGAAAGINIKIKPEAGVTATISGATASGAALIRLFKVSNFTLDGSNNGTNSRDLTIRNTATSGTVAAIHISSSGTNAGTKNAVIKNCNVEAGSNIINTTYGIVAGSTTVSTTGGGDNDNLTIENNKISKAAYGIAVRGTSAANLDNLIIRNNEIGGTSTSDYIAYKGIEVQYAASPVLETNTVGGVYGFDGSAFNISALEIGTGVTSAQISRNKVSDIVQPSIEEYGAYGINITAGTNHLIINNVITGINMLNYDATTMDYNPFGIRLAGGTGHKVYYNSVNLYGATMATKTVAGAALVVTSTSVTGLDIRNNIFANSMDVTGTSGYQFALWFPAAYNFTNATLNHNGYFVSNDAEHFIGKIGITAASGNYADMAAWRAVSQVNNATNDTESEPLVNGIAPFTSNTVLTIPAGTSTPAESGGITIAASGSDKDINNVDRPAGAGTAPDMGAYEFDGITGDFVPPVIANLQATPSAFQCDPAARTITVDISDNVAVTSALLKYSFGGVPQPDVTLTLVAGNSYTGTIPPTPGRNIDVTYFIEATDGTSVVSSDPVTFRDATLTINAGADIQVNQGAAAPVLTATSSALHKALRITEVVQAKGGTGAGTMPAYVSGTPASADLLEITNLSSETVALNGLTILVEGAGADRGYTFSNGETLAGNGIMVVHIGTGTDDAANNFYNTSGGNDLIGATEAAGFVLKSGNTIIDAFASRTHTFSIASGVTSADWSGAVITGSGAGYRRSVAADNNLSSDWTIASGTNVMNVGVANMVFDAVTLPVITWTSNPVTSTKTGASITTDALPTIQTYIFTASITDNGCTTTDEVNVEVVAPEAPDADFTATPTIVAPNQTVTFTDASTTGVPDTWNWVFSPNTVTFVGGTSPASQNPEVRFTAEGKYTVTLTVTNANGINTDTETKTDFIIVDGTAPVISNITPSPAAVQCTPTERTITATVADAVSGVGTVTLKYAYNGVAQTDRPMGLTSGDAANGTYQATLPAPLANNVTVSYSITATDAKPNTSTSSTSSFTDAYTLFVNAGADQQVNQNASAILTATSSMGYKALRITEVVQNKAGTGIGTVPPSASGTTSTADFMEITNLSPGLVDLNGVTILVEGGGTHNYTFGNNVTLAANGVILVHLGTGTNDAANNYYNTGGTSDQISSTSAAGYVLKKGTEVIDAFASRTHTFSAASGVQPTDWSGTVTGGNAGYRRKVAADNNSASDWVVSDATDNVMNLGVINAGLNTINPPANITWTSVPPTTTQNGTSINTGALTTVGTYVFTATLNDGTCTVTDEVSIGVQAPQPPDADFSADITNANTTQTVTLTDLTTNLPDAWKWEITPNTFTFEGGTTDESQNPKVKFTKAGAYTVKLTASNANGANSDVEVKTNYINVVLSYCTPVYVFGPANGDFINGVAIGTINNQNTGSSAPGSPSYTNYTTNPAISTDLKKLEPYELTVTNNPSYTGKYAAWIDYNQDGIFETAEKLGDISVAAAGTGKFTGTVPLTALTGPTRLRVRQVYSSSTSIVMDPCTSYDEGEAEDYAVNILAPEPMVYASSTVKQTNLAVIGAGSTDKQMLDIEIVTTGKSPASKLNGITFNTNGSTNVATDIAAAKLYTTGTANTFNLATATLVGTAVANPNGSFDVTPATAVSLANGTNYFWLTYDITSSATASNLVDAEVMHVTVDGVNQVPAPNAPAGTRQIEGALAGNYEVGTGFTAPGFTTLEEAVTALNTRGISDDVNFILINNSYTVTAPLSVNRISGSSSSDIVTIKPQTATAVSVTNSGTGSLFELNNADYFVIDGSNNGTTSQDLTLTTASTTNPVISFANDATNNVVKNIVIESANTTATSGAIVLGTTGASGTGNDDNQIQNNVIRNRTSATYANAIYAAGTATATNNSITIESNSLSNFTGIGIGVTATGNGDNWNITGNHFFNNGTPATAQTAQTAISFLPGASSNGNTISGNVIGGQSANAGGTEWLNNAVATSPAIAFKGIEVNSGTTTGTSIQGNTIRNIRMSNTGASSFRGIDIVAGKASIGNITGNNIGNSSATGSITLNGTGASAGITSAVAATVSNNNVRYFTLTSSGALTGVSVTGAATITGNTISSITASGSAAITGINTPTAAGGATITGNGINTLNGTSGTMIGITNSNSGTNTISTNTITGFTVSGSSAITGIANTAGASTIQGNTISQLSTSSTGTMIGVNNTSTGAVTIEANQIVNLMRTGTSGSMKGISHTSAGSLLVKDNTMNALKTASTATGTTNTASLIGISLESSSPNLVVEGNTVNELWNTAAGTANTCVLGILNYTSGGVLTMKRNRMYDLRNASTGTAPLIYGVYFWNGAGNIETNMISINNGGTASATVIRGIYENSAATSAYNLFYNTVYVGGIATGSANSQAFYRATDMTLAAKNNIFYNARTGGTGIHTAVTNAVATAAAKWTAANVNNNLLYAANTATIGQWAGTTATANKNLATWQTSSAADANSFYSPVVFRNTVSDLGLATNDNCNLDGRGVAISSINQDFSGNTRVTTQGSTLATRPDVGYEEFTPDPALAGTWTGATSATWGTDMNWCLSSLPTATSSIVIPQHVSNYPNVTAGTAQINNLTVSSGASLTVSGGTLEVYGALVNNGTFSNTSGWVEFKGGNGQLIPGLTFANLRINGAGTKTLGNNVTVNSALDMVSGILNTTNSLKVTLSPAATITESGTSHVIGLVQSSADMSTAGTYAFGGLGIKLEPQAGSANFPGLTTVVRHTGTTVSGANGSKSISRLFDIAPNDPAKNANLNVKMTMDYMMHELGTILETNLVMFKSETMNGPWEPKGYLTRDNATKQLSISGIKDFSFWTMGDATQPLPVELTSFTAVKKGSNALLNWTTAMEKDNQGFEVQVSEDGREFRALGFVEAQKGNGIRNYSFTDIEEGKSGVRYYRLKQLDLDGSIAYYGPKAVRFETLKLAVSAYPNPFMGEVNVTIQSAQAETATVSITDMAGKTVYQQQVKVAKGLSTVKVKLNDNHAAGIYLMTTQVGGERLNTKLIKQ